MKTPAQSARFAIVLYSLGITGGLIIFLILSQPIGLPFDYAHEQNLRLIDVVLPTFFAYLGSASHFIFNANNGREVDDRNASMLMVLIHGPFIIFIVAVAALFFTFYSTNQPLPEASPRIDPLKYSALSRYLSVCLALLAATVSILSSYLFGTPPERADHTTVTPKKKPISKPEGTQ